MHDHNAICTQNWRPGPSSRSCIAGHNHVHYNMSSTCTTSPGLAVGLVTLQYVCPRSHYNLPPHTDPFPYPPSRQYNMYALVDFQDNEDNVQDDDEDNEGNNARQGDDSTTTGRGQWATGWAGMVVLHLPAPMYVFAGPNWPVSLTHESWFSSTIGQWRHAKRHVEAGETRPARTAGPDRTYLDLDFTVILTCGFRPHTGSCLIAGIVNVYGRRREWEEVNPTSVRY